MADTKLSALGAATLTEADELYINDGGSSKKATVAELRTALCPKGFIPLDITVLREIISDDIGVTAITPEGGYLSSDSTPALQRQNGATDKALKVDWPQTDVTEVQFPPVVMPPDLDDTVDITIHLLARMDAGTDTTTSFDVQVFDGIGDTEMGGLATPDMTSTLAELTVTIANADISGNPTGVLNISLVPEAHGTDDIELFGAWIEYTRKLPV